MNAVTIAPLYGQDRASAILVPMPMPNPPAPERRFRLVEFFRLFTEGAKGHPLYGIAVLVIIIALPVLVQRLWG